MYKVGNLTFESFEKVVKWAWSEHKIDLDTSPPTEEQKQVACRQLEDLIMQEYIDNA